MPQTFMTLILLKSQISRLEKLRRLELRLQMAAPNDRPAIQQDISSLMEEIAQLCRALQEQKARPSQPMQASVRNPSAGESRGSALRSSR
jgi:hypothetical protein